MSVHVEHIGMCSLRPMFSAAHYYEQNGDLMKDPDMVFIRAEDEYYPLEFQQDNLGLYQCTVRWNSDGQVESVNQKLQQSLANFTGEWMSNIRQQQKL